MKKYVMVICFVMAFSLASIISAKAGYFTGPNNSLYVTVNSSTLWVEGTLSNDSAQHYKKIYAQSGSQGSWSALVKPAVHSVSQKDTRAIWEVDTSFVKPCWKVNQTDGLSCRF